MCFTQVRQLFDAGIRVCINTDDPGIMNIDLPGEYQIWRVSRCDSGISILYDVL